LPWTRIGQARVAAKRKPAETESAYGQAIEPTAPVVDKAAPHSR
jgi:hypothetical protein